MTSIDEITKTCLDCLEEKAITQFVKNCRMSDGYLNHCKICIKIRRENNVGRCEITEKKCNGCQIVKSIDQFYRKTNGWHSKCIICFRILDNARYSKRKINKIVQ